ncbi:family 16 glycosylhydrolase, partial [Methylobacterium sp. Leaf113]|uniref:family 16 glycosylhydrolase n=1 Tax=Methylobacterium sp. Leaf113 TaxID=1736259 RepID=UPI0009E8880D
TINGGAGNDIITGGLGVDLLTGGAGADRFVFSKADLAGTAGLTGTALDRITDFEGAGAAGGDTLVFRGFAADANVVEIARQGTLHTYEIREHGTAVGRFTAAHANGTLKSGDFVFEASAETPVVAAPPVLSKPPVVVAPPVLAAPSAETGEAARASATPTHTIKANNAVKALSGTAGHDDIWGWDKGGAVLTGGTGDDTYHIWQSSDQVVEAPGGGVDTVIIAWRDYTLSANVENLIFSNAKSGTGNGLNNMITGDGGAQTLNGKAGNDILTGRGGADTFIIAKGEGSDIITDFASGVDKVRMEGVNLHGFSELKLAAKQVGSDTVIALGGGETLTLQNVALTNLKAGDFALPADPSHPGMKLSFADEFNTLSASANGKGTVWKSALGIGNEYRTLEANSEAQYYSDKSVGTNPFSVSDGVLTITAAPDHDGNPLGLAYTSGVLTTAKSFAQTYGYFEMRAELPAGQGMWPAFWLMNAANNGRTELDVMELLGHDTDTAYVSAHSKIGGHTLTSFPVQTEDLTEGFHTFGVDWQKDTLKWYIDGAKVAEMATPRDMNEPMYMLVNLAVGDTGSWPGKYDASMPTAQMNVDYVRVWANDDLL